MCLCLIPHDLRRPYSWLRASLELFKSKTRKASRTRDIGCVFRSVSGSCCSHCARSVTVWKACSMLSDIGCAALSLSKERLRVHPATPGCSVLLAVPTIGASCSALLAGPAVWPSRLARILLPSVMTACCKSVIKDFNGRRRVKCFCLMCHDEHRGSTSACPGLGFCLSTDTAIRSF